MVSAKQFAAKFSFIGPHRIQQKLVCCGCLWYKARRRTALYSDEYESSDDVF